MKALSIFVLAGVLAVGGNAQTKAPQQAKDFALKTVTGSTIKLSNLKGKVVLLNFWATWCGPCRAEIPDFSALYEEYKSKGFEIVGVSLDDDGWDSVTPFVKKYKIPYPIVLGNGKVVDEYGGFEFIPTTFLIDKKGNIVDKHVGMMNRAQLEKKLKDLL